MNTPGEPASGDLVGRLSIVTGAGDGIGAGISSALAEHGAAVACVDIHGQRARQSAERLAACGSNTAHFAHDVRDWDASTHLIRRIEDYFSMPADILVNNAGIYFSSPIAEMDMATHENLLAVNINGAFAMCAAIAPHMRARRFGKIINIASISGKDTNENSASYGASKAALIALTISLSKELGPHNINVNAVCPGLVFTQLQAELCEQSAEDTDLTAEEIWASRVAKIPLGRAQEAEDIGEMVVFLASERARNITGQAINVCGGLQTGR